MSIRPWPKVNNRRSTAYIVECDFCHMTYGINHNYMLGICDLPHICNDCLDEHWHDLQGREVPYMTIPCLEYTDGKA